MWSNAQEDWDPETGSHDPRDNDGARYANQLYGSQFGLNHKTLSPSYDNSRGDDDDD